MSLAKVLMIGYQGSCDINNMQIKKENNKKKKASALQNYLLRNKINWNKPSRSSDETQNFYQYLREKFISSDSTMKW